MKNIALITGATGGLGQEFVKLHAQRKGDLVLVAREQGTLDKLKEKVEKEYGVEAYTIAIDLSQPDAAERIYNELKGKGIAIDYLLNNAGFGGQGDFFTRTMEQDMSMIAVNVVTLTKLTKLFLPDMIKRGSGRVLNVSSTAAMMPGPRQAVYYATKAFVTSMSNSIYMHHRCTSNNFAIIMTSDKAIVKKAPRTADKDVAFNLVNGVKVEIIDSIAEKGSNHKWYKIETGDERTGWLQNDSFERI